MQLVLPDAKWCDSQGGCAERNARAEDGKYFPAPSAGKDLFDGQIVQVDQPKEWMLEQIRAANKSVALRPEWMTKLADQDMARLNQWASDEWKK